MAFEEGSEHAAAVEGECGKHVEGGEQQVEPREAGEERAGDQVDRIQRLRQRDGHQCGGDPERGAGGRARDGQRELVAGRLREGLEAGDATDRQEVDLVHDEPVAPTDEAVRQLVEDDTGEDHDEPDERRGDARALRGVPGQDEQRDEQEEAGVHADLDARDATDRERPAPAAGWASAITRRYVRAGRGVEAKVTSSRDLRLCRLCPVGRA